MTAAAILWAGSALFAGYLILDLAEVIFFTLKGFLSLCRNIGFVLLLLVVAYGFGKRILLSIIGLDSLSRFSALTAIALGFAVMAYCFFLLASLKLLYPLSLWLVLVIMLCSGIREIVSGARSGLRYLASLPDKLSGLSLAELSILIIFAAFLLLALIMTLTPPGRYDSLVYHLQVPRLYLDAHGFERIPSNLYSNLNFNFDLLYGFALGISRDISARLIHYLFGILLITGIYDFTLSISGRRLTGLLASMFYALTPLFFFEITSAYIELALSFYIFLAFMAGIRFYETRDRRWLLLSAILAGVALGGKNTAVAEVAALGILILYWSRRPLPALKNSLVFVAVILVFILPWLLKNYVLMKNPFYPFLSSVFGTLEWDQTVLDRYLHFQRLLYTCTGIPPGDGISAVAAHLDRLHLGFMFPLFGHGKRILQTLEFNAIPPPLALALAPFYFFLPVRHRWLNLGWVFFLLTLPLWALSAPRARFLLPILMMVSISASLALCWILDRIRNKILLLSAFLFIIINILILFPYEIGYIGDDLRFITGSISRQQYLEAIADRPGTNNMNDILFLNQNTDPRARVFMISEGRGYYLEREYMCDSYPSVSYTRHVMARCGDAGGFYQWLLDRGFTHILYDRDAAPPGPSSCLLEETVREFRLADEIYERFKREHANVLSWNPESGVEILELKK